MVLNPGLPGLAGAGKGNGLTLQPEVALVGAINAVDQLDQCRFPGPVLADQGVDLSRVDVDRDGIEGGDPREPFGEVDRLERRFATGHGITALVVVELPGESRVLQS